MPTLPIPVFVAILLCFAVFRIWQVHKAITPIGILLVICAAQSLIIALSQHYMLPHMRFVQPITASMIPPASWLAYQMTAVRRWHPTDTLHVLVPIICILILLIEPAGLDIYLPFLFVAYGALIVRQGMQGSDAQPRAFLSSGDIPSKIWLVIGIALIVSALSDALIVATQMLGQDYLKPWIITVFSVGNLLVIGGMSTSPHLLTDDSPEIAPPPKTAEPDAAVMNKITAYMAEAEPYLDPDLTLTKLSRKLGLPAKTISATINAASGNNVSRFINDARIKAAQDQMLGGENITSAMFASGFNTKSNFNREFLRITGSSPTAWLKLKQG